MSDIAIKFENVSKQYRLGTIGTGTLSHDLSRWWARVRGKEDPYLKIGQENVLNTHREPGAGSHAPEIVWALKDINLDVRQGEVLGIIGKNGAGKSTLLKLLSRVTTPTTGSIKVRGRIASLLEVGTGFHLEMTGRENIFMNGSIMGMTKAEIRRKFDEIVDFAGVETYIDTPVKRYSSGMLVRLGFAVAAHLEPEILVVDEILAVGDSEFQSKAIGKMQSVSNDQGRTILFVSHNMGAVRSLCPKAIFLDHGSIKKIAGTEEVINKYLSQNASNSISYQVKKADSIYISFASLVDSDGESTNSFDFKDNIYCKVIIRAREIYNSTNFAIALLNKYKNRVFSSDHSIVKYPINENGEISFVFEFPNLPYAPGIYSLNLSLHMPNVLLFEVIDDILPFEILDKGSTLSKYSSFTGDMLAEGKISII